MALARATTQRSYKAGQVVFNEGDEGATLFVVRQGVIKITVGTGHDDQLTLALLQPGQYFGEMALLDGEPRSATAEALEDASLVLLTHAAFAGCLVEFPEVAIALLKDLSGRLRGTNLLAADLANHSVELRLIHLFLKLAATFGRPVPAGVIIPVS